MVMKAFFFDTYALHEIVMGNPSYIAQLQGVSIVTTRLNLMELHYVVLAKLGKEDADRVYDAFLPAAIDIDDALVKSANEFRLGWKRRKVSYVDCIGYLLAQRMGIQFLTGDMQFKDAANVMFIR
jgi:predicted nucleic acid-binding protein